jgi:arylsulfatase A-like enzyme
MIDCHDLGQHLGCYGWSTVPSANLDRLARAGVRFANSFCTAPQCCPSRAALYTGRYAHANGMFGLAHAPFNWRLHPTEVHLGRLMQQAGYVTAQVGVQHVTAHQEEAVKGLGFDHALLCLEAGQTPDRVAEFLDNRPDGPFFLNIGFVDPHRDPQGLFKQAPPHRELGVEIPAYLPQTPEAEAELAEFQGVIHQLDQAVGRIWAMLTERDLLKDSWFIFTTDHGIAMPRAKCTMYDPGIETALIMLGEPFGLVGGRVYDELISNVDLLPTLLEMLGIPVPAKLQGHSFAGLLRGREYIPRTYLFAEKTFHTAYEPQRAVRSSRYKLIWNAEVDIMNVAGDIMRSPIYPQMIQEIVAERPPFELYDLDLDPLERNNLFDHPDYATIRQQMAEELRSWMVETGDPLLNGPIPSPYHLDSRAWLMDL